MRKLVYYVATTLDGFIAAPGGADPSGSQFFPLADSDVEFISEHYPETLPAPARQALGINGPGQAFDTVLEGRASYEVGLAAGLANAYPHLRHIVFSTSLKSDDPSIEVVRGNALDRVRQLKAEAGKDLWLVGGGTLAHSLLGEIDRLVLKQHSSIIGSGIPLFNGPFHFQPFRLADELTLGSGLRVLTFDRA